MNHREKYVMVRLDTWNPNTTIDKNDKDDKVFGQGSYRLLILVDKSDYLNKAAGEMGMSYSKVLNILRRAEKVLNCSFWKER